MDEVAKKRKGKLAQKANALVYEKVPLPPAAMPPHMRVTVDLQSDGGDITIGLEPCEGANNYNYLQLLSALVYAQARVEQAMVD